VVVGRTPKAAFKDINPGLGIPYKSVRPIKVRPQLSAYSAEFALISAVSKISLLNKMIDSPKESDRNTINRILKNAAILQPRAGFLSKRPTNNGGAGGVISNGGNAMVSGALSANAENISTEKTKLLKGSAEIFAREKGRLIDLTIAKSAGNLPEIPGICWLEYVKDSWEDKSKLNGTKNSDSRQEIAGLVSCTVNTILKTDLGEIECKRGSQMFVVDRKDCVAICTLDASSIADVILHVGEKFTSKIPPGREILLTKDLSAPFENLCPARQISHRDSIELGTVSNTRVSAVEFSLPSAILAISPLGEKLSSNNAEDRKIVDAMLKNAVILTKITAADGPYRSAD
jgi:hypothetical protein